MGSHTIFIVLRGTTEIVCSHVLAGSLCDEISKYDICQIPVKAAFGMMENSHVSKNHSEVSGFFRGDPPGGRIPFRRTGNQPRYQCRPASNQRPALDDLAGLRGRGPGGGGIARYVAAAIGGMPSRNRLQIYSHARLAAGRTGRLFGGP